MSEAPRVSVIVAARNAEGSMPALLERFERQTLPRDLFEVIVVDDDSDDGTAGVIQRSDIAQLVRMPRRGGAYVARNAGLERARAAVVAVTDADCLPSQAWLEEGLEELDRQEADLLGGHLEVPLRARPSMAEIVDFVRYLDQRRAFEEAGFLATANIFIRRHVFDRVGPFNDRVISGGDREFSLKAAAAGLKVAYTPRAVVVHEPRLTARGLVRKAYRIGYGRAQVERHGHEAARGLPVIWRRPGAYIPGAFLGRAPVYGIDRLAEKGYRPNALTRRRIALAEWAFVQLPMVVGNFMADRRET